MEEWVADTYADLKRKANDMERSTLYRIAWSVAAACIGLLVVIVVWKQANDRARLRVKLEQERLRAKNERAIAQTKEQARDAKYHERVAQKFEENAKVIEEKLKKKEELHTKTDEKITRARNWKELQDEYEDL